MTWLFVDLAIGVFALLVLGLVGYTLFTRVRSLSRAVSAASARVTEASAGLDTHPPRR